jgi:hypothetical protein
MFAYQWGQGVLMQLTTQEYAAVISHLRGSSAGARGSELRRTARMEIQSVVSVGAVNDGGKVTGRLTSMTRDISMEGIGLLQSNAAPQGAKIVVELPESSRQSLLILGQVMHTRCIAHGIYSLGVQFLERANSAVQSSWQAYNHSQFEQKRIQDSILG